MTPLRRQLLFVSVLLTLSLPASTVSARTFMTQEQALGKAFSPGTRVSRQTFFLTRSQLEAAKKRAGLEFEDQLIVRYTGVLDGKIVGYAYFDTHRVRTLPETVMMVVTGDGAIERIEILSFNEPPDYFPRPRWIEQLEGRSLNDELALNRAVRPITGASLTGRAIVNASRKILAVHSVLPAGKVGE